MEPAITATRSQMIAALEDWERDATEQGWSGRDDEDRHAEAADYLFMRLRAHGAA